MGTIRNQSIITIIQLYKLTDNCNYLSKNRLEKSPKKRNHTAIQVDLSHPRGCGT